MVEAEQVDLGILRRLAEVSAQVNDGQRLDATLQAVADGVVDVLGFGAAAVNYVLANGDLQILAVAGPRAAREALAGRIVAKEAMDALLSRCETWGRLRFASHALARDTDPVNWVPEVEVPPSPDAWHPDDALLAPLHASDGAMVGVLSVDLPPGQRRPGPVLCELLAMFAVQAGVAIANARVTEQLRQEHLRLQASETAFRFSFFASGGAMGTLSLGADDLGRFLQVNDAFCATVGYRPDELDRLRWPDLVAAAERAASEALLERFATGDQPYQRSERQMVRKDGSLMWCGVTATVIAADVDQPPFLLLHLEDITERKSREATLSRQALLDPLTGLANRRGLVRHLHDVIADATQTGRRGTVFYADLDRFKRINDRYGHAVGDRALREAAARLRARLRSADLIARPGGDEFVVVAQNLDPDQASELVARVHDAFDQPLAAAPEVVTISIGAVSFDAGTRDVDTLLHQADLAMYADKRARHRSP